MMERIKIFLFYFSMYFVAIGYGLVFAGLLYLIAITRR